jgi:Aldose 1-epimerase
MRPSLTAQIGVAAGGLTAALLPPIEGDAALVETAMPPPYVTLQEQNFRTEIDGKPVDLYTIRNPAGMEVRITNYGARIEQILVPDRHGRLGDVVQGYETGLPGGRGPGPARGRAGPAQEPAGRHFGSRAAGGWSSRARCSTDGPT